MTTDIELFSGNKPLQESFGKLNAEIASLIQQRYAEYDSCMQISAREYFSECVEEFLANFCQAMEDCSMQLTSIARRIKKKLRITLMHFHEYIVRGLWIIHESPRCKEQIEDMYFIPDTFDIESLRSLIDEVRESMTLEDSVSDMVHRDVLRSLRINMLQSLDSICKVIDGDKKMQAFTIRRWVAKLRSDLREVRSIYESRWEQAIESVKGESCYETICQLRDDVSDEIEGSDFYIDNLDNLDELVRKIHSFQGHGRGEDLDRFLHDYALLEFLEEKLQKSTATIKRQANNYIIKGDAHIYTNSTVNNNF